MEFATMMELLLSGLAFTLQIFVTTLIGSLPLGVLVAFGRMSRFKPVALVTRFYISVMRGTPLMLQLMALMFGPYYLFGLQMGNDWKYWRAPSASSSTTRLLRRDLPRRHLVHPARQYERPRCWATRGSRRS